MRKLLWLGVASLAVLACSESSAFADVFFTFSGSGTSGSISVPGGGSIPWVINSDPITAGQSAWGSPGLGNGIATWPSTGPQESTLTISFTLPSGVTINPNPPPSLGGFTNATRFEDDTTGKLWSTAIAPGGNSVTFTAPAGSLLNPNDNFFVNVVFTGDVTNGGVPFTGSFGSVPEPTSLALFGLTTLAGAAFCGWRRRQSAVA